ncbi:MAG: cupin domain-containing protein [Bacteroidia bacterium]|nr:MAG: cupin domain-containing protein [Bacteroidia bacterium]
MRVTTLQSAKRVPFQLDGRIMLSGKHVEVIHLSLLPYETLPAHVNDFDVSIYVLEGHGLIKSGSKSIKALPGMMVEIRRGAERGMQNMGEAPFRVLVLKLFPDTKPPKDLSQNLI